MVLLGRRMVLVRHVVELGSHRFGDQHERLFYGPWESRERVPGQFG
jgi:hypothetical protein